MCETAVQDWLQTSDKPPMYVKCILMSSPPSPPTRTVTAADFVQGSMTSVARAAGRRRQALSVGGEGVAAAMFEIADLVAAGEIDHAFP